MAVVRVVCKGISHLIACNSRSSFVRTEIHIASRLCQNGNKVNWIRRQPLSNKKKRSLPFEVDTSNVAKDVLVYSHKNDRFYKLLTYFGCAQFAFWAYLALFSFQTLRDAPESPGEEETVSWWRSVAQKESKYKNGISFLCFAFGYVVLCISVMYPTRAVRQLWLLKGGHSVRLETYSVLAPYQKYTVPVNSISCLQTRADSAAQIPMKLKGRWFFFLLDKRGKFHDTHLFDFSVGLNRTVR